MKTDTTKKRATTVVGVWLAVIFITSCFLIPFDPFVHFVQGLVPSAAFKQGFEKFWLVSWFFVVKGWHATEYAILLTLLVAALQHRTNWSRRKCIGVALGFSVLFAASDEWHQTFVPDRDGCLRDVIIDSTGALIASLFLLIRRRKEKGSNAKV